MLPACVRADADLGQLWGSFGIHTEMILTSEKSARLSCAVSIGLQAGYRPVTMAVIEVYKRGACVFNGSIFVLVLEWRVEFQPNC